MAIESPQAAPKAEVSDRVAAIENEIPAYRAIQPLAVISLILGFASALSFADFWFLPTAAAAVALGLRADWKIRTLPEIFTGRALAQAGVALGIIFSFSSITIGYVQDMVLRREAIAFAKHYTSVLKKGSLDHALWYRLPPDARQTTAPEEVVKKFSAGQQNPKDPTGPESHMAPTRSLIARITKPGADVHVDRIEKAGFADLSRMAHVLLEIHDPGTKEAAPDGYALLQLKSDPSTKVPGWWILELNYPYKPDSAVLKAAKAVDDGHGHAH